MKNTDQLTFLNLGFSLAFDNSSSKYVLTPILQSITHGWLKSLNKSCSCKYAIFFEWVKEYLIFLWFDEYQKTTKVICIGMLVLETA